MLSTIYPQNVHNFMETSKTGNVWSQSEGKYVDNSNNPKWERENTGAKIGKWGEKKQNQQLSTDLSTKLCICG